MKKCTTKKKAENIRRLDRLLPIPAIKSFAYSKHEFFPVHAHMHLCVARLAYRVRFFHTIARTRPRRERAVWVFDSLANHAVGFESSIAHIVSMQA
jgi:hypothetical protein